MDFSVGIAVLVLVTVLVVAVIGYGIYLNRRHDQWENVVGHAASDGQSKGLSASNFSAKQRTSHKFSLASAKSSGFATSKKTRRTKASSRVAPTVKTLQGKVAKQKDPVDSPELPHMSIEDVYRGGIPTSEGRIIKHEIKGKRADVFGEDSDQRSPSDQTENQTIAGGGTSIPNDSATTQALGSDLTGTPSVPIVEGIVGEVVKKPRDEMTSTSASEHRWTKENNAHLLKSEQCKSNRLTSKVERPERVVPLRKGSTKILANGASKARQDRSHTNADKSRLEEYVVLRVSGKHENAFPLRELARFMLNRNLKFDNVGLFSMHDEETDELMFKVADVYSPGQFDRAQIETYCTEGLTFIMCLAPLTNPQQSFEQMLSLASECARCFDAVVQDEHSNKLSNQTITHYRYRVADFRRKQMSM